MFLIPLLDNEKKRKEKRNTLRKQKQNKKERKNETNTKKKTSLFFTLDIIGIRMGLHLNQQSPTINVLSKQ